MAIDTIAQRLRDLDIFHGLAPAHIERIAREAERIIFRDGQVMATAGAEADGAMILIAGRATVLADAADADPIHTIETGSMLAEPAMLVEHQFGLTVVAEGDVRAVKVTRTMLRELMLEDAAVTDHFVGRIAARLTRVAIELRLIDERLAIVCAAPDNAVGSPGSSSQCEQNSPAPEMASA